ncbi:MAG: YceI-like domain protein [Akkermansiaceae bacterium]|nr:YceI-like domain protein [Akkermansiaceae bacterium]
MKTTRIATGCALALSCLTAAQANSLTVDKSRSRIQVDARATGHSFTGTLNDYQAAISGNGRTLEPAAVALTWKFSDLKTGDDKRDREMLKWLGAAPEGSFRFIKTWKEGDKTMAQGTLAIHGISKTIAFPYTATKEGEWVTIDGTATLNYQDFSLPLIESFAVMKVDPALSVRFHLVGQSK